MAIFAQLPDSVGRLFFVNHAAASRNQAPRVVFCATGTKGDLFPVLALGREMVSRGYECELLANQGYDALARENGLAFHAVTVPQTNNLVAGVDNLDHHIMPSYGPTLAYFERESRRGRPLVVVNLEACSGSNLAAELHGIPVCRLVLAPSRFRSVHRPSWPLSLKLRGPLARTYQRYRLPQVYHRMDRAPVALSRINPFREAAGLKPLESFSEIDRGLALQIGFFPDWFGQPQPDWPKNLRLVGFPLPSSTSALPASLESALRQGPTPIVFTPGTGVVQVNEFFSDAARCCERLGRPGVFLSRHYRLPAELRGRNLLHFDFVDLAPLLERSAALVHHGGIGTTARALEAGIPQFIRSMAYDQPDNGERVAQLGLGTYFAPGMFDGERLEGDLRRFIGDPTVAHRLREYRSAVRTSDAIRAAADLLEQQLRRVERPLRSEQTQPGLSALGGRQPERRGLIVGGNRAEGRHHFVFETIGTRGDVAPLVATAAELRERGHRCTVLGPVSCAPLARRQGVAYVSTTEKSLDAASNEVRFSDFYFPALRQVAQFFKQLMAEGEAPLVVNIDKTASSNLCCERYGIVAARVHLSPFKLRSIESPPVPYGRMFGEPSRVSRQRLSQFFRACDEHPGLVGHINACRRQLSLSPVRSASAEESHLREQMCFFPEWFAPAAADWPAVRHLGFPLPDERHQLSEELEAFLEAGAPPVVFTTGTGVFRVEEFFRQARRCLEATGRRGLLLSPSLARSATAGNVRCESFVELGAVLPRAALLVHHGGIGTLARAVEAGVPQIISPLSYDQPDNAERAERLGLGVVLPRERLTGQTLAEKVEQLLSPAWSRRELRACCGAAPNGAAGFALELERIARQGERGGRPSPRGGAAGRPWARPAAQSASPPRGTLLGS